MVRVYCTNPVAAEQEPQRLELSDVHGCGLETVAQVSGELSSQVVFSLLVTEKKKIKSVVTKL